MWAVLLQAGGSVPAQSLDLETGGDEPAGEPQLQMEVLAQPAEPKVDWFGDAG